jgi:hypothetical protein
MAATQKARGGRRPGAGRPAVGFDPVRTVRISDALMARIDSWADWQDDRPGRSEAIRRLIELGLTLDRLWEDLATKLSTIPLKVQAPDLAHQDPPHGQNAADWPSVIEEHLKKNRETPSHGS